MGEPLGSNNAAILCRGFSTGGRLAVRAKWRQIFAEADADQSGFLDAAEVRRLLNKHAEDAKQELPTDKHVDECIEYADKNKDGKIDLDELVHLLHEHDSHQDP